MAGFFSMSALKKTSSIKIDVDSLEPDCTSCGLYLTCNSPRMQVSGEGKKEILILGSFSSQEDDEYGIHFVDPASDRLSDELKSNGISLTRDCWKFNAVSCMPKDPFKGPTKTQIQHCRPAVQRAIKTLKPKLIILLGNIAIESLYGTYFSNRSVERWRAHRIPDPTYKCWVVPTFHHEFLAYKKHDKNLHRTFSHDIKKAVSTLNLTYTGLVDYEKAVTVLTDFSSVVLLLKRIIRRKIKVTFDYETTGLKPYKKGHKLATIGIAVSPTKAFAFPFEYKTFWTKHEFAEIHRLWKCILADKQIKKIAHNYPFEEMWSKKKCGIRPNGMYWDSLLCQHIIDNRSFANGLKFQTFIRYGVLPYDEHISPFLKPKKGEFNTVEKAPFKDLLLYNGLDCIFTRMLYEDQVTYLSGRQRLSRAFGFFMLGQYTMSTIHYNGIKMDMVYYTKAAKQLERKIADIKKYLETGREARAFKDEVGRPIAITSNKDLGILFFEVLGKTGFKTDAGNYKTDKTTLEKLNLPFVDKLTEMKVLQKAKGTYLAQFAREVCKGVMRPFFGLIMPKTYRGSSALPNFQNLPKRNPEVSKIVRTGIVPSPGCVIGEIDFSGAEVITSASYHKDPTFIHDITIGDMHRDLATEIWQLPQTMLADAKKQGGDAAKLAKMIRFFAKSKWTFAQFYGDWFKSCGTSLWEFCVESEMMLPNGISLREWIADKGIYELGEVDKGNVTPGSFLEHCARMEDKKWNERFVVYTQWKKDTIEFYRRYGYLETFLGFRYTGYMDTKQCTGYQIQGTSFHLLVFTLNKVMANLVKYRFKTKVIGQIHDSLISDIHAKEVRIYHEMVHEVVSGLKTKFGWMVVPMEIEAEISQVREEGGNFSELREVDPLNVELW